MNWLKKGLTSLLLMSLSFSGMSQDRPHRLSPAEDLLLPVYIETLREHSSQNATPPASEVRTPAEWEEIDALLVTWRSYISVVREIIRHAREETHVIVVCSDSNAVKSNLSSNGIPLTNVSYLETATNSVWIRDYGPWNVYTNDVDSLLVVDWIYNRPRPADDQVPVAVSTMLNLPIYQMTTAPYDLVNTGGNFMTDGFGKGFASRLVLDENWNGSFNLTNKNEAMVDSLMKMFMGIDPYIKMNTLPYDAIHHIDMHMKLLDEETLLVGQYPQGIADGPQIESNLQYVISNFTSAFGTPYKVIRIPMPPDKNGKYPHQGGDYRTYANAVFVNSTVLVPVYETQYDTTALRIWRQALPGYKIKGIYADGMISAFGAIHCITKAIYSSDPLLISHQPLSDTWDTQNPYSVSATIRHRSGIQQATLYYTTDTAQPYQSVQMSLHNAPTNTWQGFIPPQLAGSEVFYYIEAHAQAGKKQVRPLPAPEAYWNFRIQNPSAIGKPSIAIANHPYPNPASDILNVNLQLNKSIDCSITLAAVDGTDLHHVYSGNLDAGAHNIVINTNHFAKGIYFLKILTTNEALVYKILIQ